MQRHLTDTSLYLIDKAFFWRLRGEPLLFSLSYTTLIQTSVNVDSRHFSCLINRFSIKVTSEIQTIHLQLGVTFLIKPNNQNLFFSQPVAASFPVQRKTCGGMGGGGGAGGKRSVSLYLAKISKGPKKNV